jgi:hypothetical protein
MMLIAFLGLLVLRKVLLRYFEDKTVALTLVCLALGSNYLNYGSIDLAMTHNTLFTLYACLLYFTIRFHERPTVRKAIGIGAICGLATLIRPTEIISIIIPILWNLEGKGFIGRRFRFFWNNMRYPVSMAVSLLAVYSIQLIYWKSVSGDWFVYSYQDEGFDWLRPHVKNGLVSYRSGWLMYSPIMILSLAGFYFLYKKWKNIFIACFVFMIIFMYLCFAWETWWYGGSLGQRAMIQSYPVLAFPICALFTYVWNKRRFIKIVVGIFIGFCILYNFWLTHQAHRGGLFKAGEMTRGYFWAIFGKSSVDEETIFLLDNPDQGMKAGSPVIKLFHEDFEKDSLNTLEGDSAINSRSLYLNRKRQSSPEYDIELKDELNLIRASATFRAYEKEWDTWKMPQFMIRFYRNGNVIKTSQIRVSRVLDGGETRRFSMEARIPAKHDRCTVTFWNSNSDKTIVIDGLEVTGWK